MLLHKIHNVIYKLIPCVIFVKICFIRVKLSLEWLIIWIHCEGTKKHKLDKLIL